MKKSVFHFRTSVILLGTLLVLTVSCTPYRSATRKNMTVAFYNVENLFDTRDAPDARDEEFTPEGSKKWDEIRYQKKLGDLSRVISGINEGDLPELVGLCEVENQQVVADLIHTGLLDGGNYRIVHHESPDFRGIDCALIYRPGTFKVLYDAAVPVQFNEDPDYVTRDILYVKGRTRNREEFHVFVNHWPSRIGGEAETEGKRTTVAALLKEKIDSIKLVSPQAHILVMGDMNDEPDNKSLAEVLNARPPSTQGAALVNLMFPEFREGRGSYNYRGDWNMLDNIIVSPSLLDDKGWKVVNDKGYVYHTDWMEYTNSEGDTSPNRTYGGPNYYGGISDHFPVYIRLRR